jgi:hypothetical protein
VAPDLKPRRIVHVEARDGGDIAPTHVEPAHGGDLAPADAARARGWLGPP